MEYIPSDQESPPKFYSKQQVDDLIDAATAINEERIRQLKNEVDKLNNGLHTSMSNNQILARERDTLLVLQRDTYNVRQALKAVMVPLQALADHAGRCAATEICGDHENMQRLAIELAKHLKDEAGGLDV